MKRVILLKSQSNTQGGLEKHTARIAKAFLEKGADPVLLTTKGPALQFDIPIVSTNTVPWPPSIRLEQFDRFVQSWLKKNPSSLIFGMDRNRHQTHLRAGNGVHAAYLKSRLLTDSRLKTLLFRFNPLHRKILEIERQSFENPSLQKLFANSEMVRSQVLEYYRVDLSKIQVIHNGVEWGEMEKDFEEWEEKREENLREYGLDPHCFHFLFIGNGYLRKGLNQLLFALSQLKEKAFQLSILGKDSQINTYLAKAAHLKIEDRVRFFGPSAEVRSFYQLADCLVIPSFYDPFANVTVEALAMGLFVISSKTNGGSEIITSQNGAVIENLLDPDAFVQSLYSAMKQKKTKRSAKTIRDSVKYLDFANQLKILIEACLE